MYTVNYFHVDTGATHSSYAVTMTSAKEKLDRFIDNGPDNVCSVAPLSVDFRNGDYALIRDLDPLCPMMREGYGERDEFPSDSIFE